MLVVRSYHDRKDIIFISVGFKVQFKVLINIYQVQHYMTLAYAGVCLTQNDSGHSILLSRKGLLKISLIWIF